MKLILDHAAVILSGAASVWQIVPGAEVRLVPTEGEVAVMVLVTSTVLLFWSRQAWRQIGQLPPDSAARVRPMLDRCETLHVRVVNVTPPQLATDGRLHIHISAWGRPPPEILPAGKRASRPPLGARTDRTSGRIARKAAAARPGGAWNDGTEEAWAPRPAETSVDDPRGPRRRAQTRDRARPADLHPPGREHPGHPHGSPGRRGGR